VLEGFEWAGCISGVTVGPKLSLSEVSISYLRLMQVQTSFLPVRIMAAITA
jgi:hypothetical protein